MCSAKRLTKENSVEVTLISPADDSYTKVADTNFTCNSSTAVGYVLSNITFSIWNSTGNLTHNETSDVGGIANQSIFNYTFVDEDVYIWGCVAVNNASDEKGSNFSVEYDLYQE